MTVTIAERFRILHQLAKSDSDRSKEGSRGGRVIGHTASGKPIYASKAPTAYGTEHHTNNMEDEKHVEQHAGDYSKQDHIDAAKHHLRESANKDHDEATRNFHRDISSSHAMSGGVAMSREWKRFKSSHQDKQATVTANNASSAARKETDKKKLIQAHMAAESKHKDAAAHAKLTHGGDQHHAGHTKRAAMHGEIARGLMSGSLNVDTAHEHMDARMNKSETAMPIDDDLELMTKSLLEGNDLVKAKYTRRTGTPGNYKYEYADDKKGGGGQAAKQPALSEEDRAKNTASIKRLTYGMPAEPARLKKILAEHGASVVREGGGTQDGNVHVKMPDGTYGFFHVGGGPVKGMRSYAFTPSAASNYEKSEPAGDLLKSFVGSADDNWRSGRRPALQRPLGVNHTID